jgi:uncharacterized protein YdbL (DUF1318 family)
MPVILSILTNKWVMLGIALLTAWIYVVGLRHSLATAQSSATQYEATARQLSSDLVALQASDAATAKLVKQSNDEHTTTNKAVAERIKTITKLEKVYVQKDSVCSLSDNVVSLLTAAGSAAIQSGDAPK